MWGWIVDNSPWILIGSGLLVFLVLLLSDKIQALIARWEPERFRGKPLSGTIAGFWYIEAIAIALVVLSLVAMVSKEEGFASVLTPETIKAWFVDKGLSNVIILVIGAVLWVVLKQAVPPLVNRIMSRPRQGESREGMKRRANTIRGVFLGLGRIVIILVVGLVIMSEYVPIGPVLAGFGIVGIAVGFGAQYLVRDLIAGIFILLENQYRVGDVARVADVSGLVEDINLRKTVLRDLDGVVHHIPNGEIRVASNFSRHFSRVNLNVSVSYGTDLDYAIEVINRTCRAMAEEERWKQVMISAPQVLRVDNLGDSGIEIKILGDVKPLEQWNVMGELRLRLKREFDKLGIEIPWPHTKVYFGNSPEDVSPVPAGPGKKGKRKVEAFEVPSEFQSEGKTPDKLPDSD